MSVQQEHDQDQEPKQEGVRLDVVPELDLKMDLTSFGVGALIHMYLHLEPEELAKMRLVSSVLAVEMPKVADIAIEQVRKSITAVKCATK